MLTFAIESRYWQVAIQHISVHCRFIVPVESLQYHAISCSVSAYELHVWHASSSYMHGGFKHHMLSTVSVPSCSSRHQQAAPSHIPARRLQSASYSPSASDLHQTPCKGPNHRSRPLAQQVKVTGQKHSANSAGTRFQSQHHHRHSRAPKRPATAACRGAMLWRSPKPEAVRLVGVNHVATVDAELYCKDIT